MNKILKSIQKIKPIDGRLENIGNLKMPEIMNNTQEHTNTQKHTQTYSNIHKRHTNTTPPN